MPRHALILAAALGLVAATADAHARLQRASPAVGSTVKVSPSEIRIDFDDELDDWKSTIALADAQGHAVALGRTRLTGRPARGLAAPLPTRLKPGSYKVKWQASSTDGHQTHGDFGFTVRPR